MKNIFSKKALALILTVLSICTALTGCAKNKIRHISLSEADTPRIIYMLGEDLDLTNGAITVAYDKEEKTVLFSDSEVSVTGYDKTKLGKQTITVTYKKNSLQYEITVYSSAVQAIHDTADRLKDADLSSDGINLSAEDGELAFSAMLEYMKLSDNERELLEKDKLDRIIIPASIHASKVYASELSSFSDSFIIKADGTASLICNEYEKTKSDLEKLVDENRAFTRSHTLLSAIKSEFGEYTLDSGCTLESFINLVSEENLAFIKGALELTTSLYEALSTVPDGWAVSDLSNYESGILEAVNIITGSDFIGPDYRYVFDIANGWRDDGDTYNIIYSYYCYTAENGRELLKNGLWQELPLPDMLFDWYRPLYQAVKEIALITDESGEGYNLRDTTDFMLLYREVLDAEAKIKSTNDALLNGIYTAICADAIFENNLRRPYGGYITHTGGMLNSESYGLLWDKYLDIVSLENENLLDFSLHGAMIEEMFGIFASLAPSEVYGFLSSLNFLYKENGGAILVLDSENFYNRFSSILNRYYESKLSNSLKPAFKELLCVIESYALCCMNDGSPDLKGRFDSKMEALIEAYGSLTRADTETFGSLFKEYYDNYLAIYSYSEDSVYPVIKFNSLYSALTRYFDTLKFISENADMTADEKAGAYTLLFSLYERANGIYEELLLSNSKESINALFSRRYDISGEKMTLDTAFYASRTVFISHLVSIFVESENPQSETKTLLFDLYSNTKLGVFLSEASVVLEYELFDTVLEVNTVRAVMDSFRNLKSSEKELFYKIGASLYYDNLEAFFLSNFADDENAKEFIRAIFEAEYAYSSYTVDPTNEEHLENFKKKMLSAISYYTLISDHNTRDVCFLTAYQYYTEIYYSLNS